MKRPKVVRLVRIPKPIWGVSKLPKLLKTLDQITTARKVTAKLLDNRHYFNPEDYMRLWDHENPNMIHPKLQSAIDRAKTDLTHEKETRP